MCLAVDPAGEPYAVRLTHRTLAASPPPDAPGIGFAVGAEEFVRSLWGALLSGGTCALGPVRPLSGLTPAGAAVLLDHRLRPVPPGIPGEVYLRGAAAGDGFPLRPGATAGTYVPDPYGAPGDRMVRTGERAVFGRDGELRRALPAHGSDDLIGGYRMDTARVGEALARHPGVAAAAAVVREDEPGERRLIAYVVPRGAAPAEAEVQAWAAERLPEYLVPSSVVALDALPVGPDGRLDRRALPAPGEAEQRGAAGRPYGRWEEPLSRLFSEVLSGKEVGADDNFFRVGGHSLLAVRLVNRVRAELGKEITLRDVFRHPTVAALAEWFAAAAAEGPAGGPAPEADRPTLRRRTNGGARLRT